ncbi:MAG TPA: tyrosine-type recombinase/integrase [Chitinophagales bacterium]
MNPFQEFLAFIEFEKRSSAHTVLAYQKDLEQFEAYFKLYNPNGNIQTANHTAIRGWIVSLMNEKITARTINRKISVLKSYYKFLLRKSVITKNPMSRIIAPKTSSRLPVFVEQKSMENLLEKVEFEEGFEGVRNKLIIELLYATGMRRSELLNLKNTDLDSYNAQLKVLGKGKKERIIPLHQNIVKTILTYKTQKPNSEYLLCDEDGAQLTADKVYRTVKKYLSMVTTIDKKSPHVLRHSFATAMLNNGAEINAVKELLGHANLAATQVYTHNTIEKLKQIYHQAHPRG